MASKKEKFENNVVKEDIVSEDKPYRDKLYRGERVFFEWRMSEYQNLKKIKNNIKIFTFFEAFLFLWALYYSNFLFALIVIISAVALLSLSLNDRPKRYHFLITDSGIWIDNELHAFIDMRSFSVSVPEAKQNRFFIFHKTKGGELRVPVQKNKAELIRLFINRYVPQREYTHGFFNIIERFFY